MNLRFTAAVLALLAGFTGCRRTPNLPPLPEVNTASFLPAVRDKVTEALERARTNPLDATANGELGMLLQAHGMDAAAGVCYRRARALDKNALRWSYYSAIVQERMGRSQEAIAAFNACLQLDPRHLPSRWRLAESLLSVGKLDEAGAAYRTALEEDPNSALILHGLGRVAAAREQWSSALEPLQRAVAIAPDYGAAHFTLSQAYQRLGDAARAAEHRRLYERHTHSAPEMKDPLLQAIRDLQAGAFARVSAGVRLAAEGKLEESARQFEEALRMDAREAAAHQNLIVVYGKLGRDADAERHYREAIRLLPGDSEAHFNYGVLLARRGRLPEAKLAFEQAIKANSAHAEARTNLGYIAEGQGQTAAAMRLYRDALANDPRHRPARFRLGRLLFQQGDAPGAIEQWRQALPGDDDLAAQALYGLSMAAASQGDRQQAANYGRQAHTLAQKLGLQALAQAIEKDLARLR